MYRRIVVKIGTSVLTGGGQRLDRAHMVDLVRQCVELQRRGHEIILCTSGAIAAGRERLGFPEVANTVAAKQMLAAVGQSRLMLVWESLFELYGVNVGQMLLTRTDIHDRHRYLNARDALQTLLDNGIVPIINENDAVATAEIKVGDNDNLSAFVALLAEANLLVLLMDQPGLFSGDPRTNPEAELIPEVRTIDRTLRELAGESVSGLGIGGMLTKLQAADVARRAGADVVIAAGHAPDVLRRIAEREPVGTRFPALETPLENRKRWILTGSVEGRQVHVDAGAARALREKGSSLLPAGVTFVEGDFERGDTVSIVDPGQSSVARGISRYSREDLEKIIGCRSDEIQERLGYAYGPVAIHRNDLIVL